MKRISNDLDRLWRMNFLRAKRVKREVTTKSGKKCSRGYKYMFTISRQGLSYIDHIVNPENTRRETADRIDKRHQNLPFSPSIVPWTIDKNMPKELQEILFQLMFKYGNEFNRFPPRLDPSIGAKYAMAMGLLKEARNYIELLLRVANKQPGFSERSPSFLEGYDRRLNVHFMHSMLWNITQEKVDQCLNLIVKTDIC